MKLIVTGDSSSKKRENKKASEKCGFPTLNGALTN